MYDNDCNTSLALLSLTIKAQTQQTLIWRNHKRGQTRVIIGVCDCQQFMVEKQICLFFQMMTIVSEDLIVRS